MILKPKRKPVDVTKLTQKELFNRRRRAKTRAYNNLDHAWYEEREAWYRTVGKASDSPEAEAHSKAQANTLKCKAAYEAMNAKWFPVKASA